MEGAWPNTDEVLVTEPQPKKPVQTNSTCLSYDKWVQRHDVVTEKSGKSDGRNPDCVYSMVGTPWVLFLGRQGGQMLDFKGSSDGEGSDGIQVR